MVKDHVVVVSCVMDDRQTERLLCLGLLADLERAMKGLNMKNADQHNSCLCDQFKPEEKVVCPNLAIRLPCPTSMVGVSVESLLSIVCLNIIL